MPADAVRFELPVEGKALDLDKPLAPEDPDAARFACDGDSDSCPARLALPEAAILAFCFFGFKDRAFPDFFLAVMAQLRASQFTCRKFVA